MSRLKEQIRAKLDGLETRQSIRNAARRCAGQLRLLYRARRRGELDDLDEARVWITKAGINQSEEVYYSVVILYAGGATLAFGPDKKLQWSASPRMFGDEPEQWNLFTDELPGEAACASSPA